MTIQEWESLYKSLKIYTQANWTILPKPTGASIREFEAESGLLLPESYRNYVTVFGAGELSFEYDIPAPGYSSSPEWDLLQFCKRVAAYFESVAEDYENSDLVSRLLYFASSKGKLTFGWDTNDVRSQEDKEYAIYQVSNTEDPVLIATSFSEFIRSVCLASPAADEEMRAFCPAHQLSSP